MFDNRFTHVYTYAHKEGDSSDMATETKSITIDGGMVNYAFQNYGVVEIGMIGVIFKLQFTSIEEAKRAVDRIQCSLGNKVFLAPIRIDKEIV